MIWCGFSVAFPSRVQGSLLHILLTDPRGAAASAPHPHSTIGFFHTANRPLWLRHMKAIVTPAILQVELRFQFAE